MPDQPTRVLNSLPTWLPPTSPWLYNQVRLLPRSIAPSVVAERRGGSGYDLGIETFFSDLPQPIQFLQRVERKVLRKRQLRFFRQRIAAERPDILHSHWGDQGWRDMRLAQVAGVPHVVTFYGKDVGYLPQMDPRWRGRYREMFDACALVLCEGPFMADRLADLGCPREKLRVQRLGVVIADIPFAPRARQAGEPLRILLAASFREKKGLPIAIAAIGMAKDALGPFEVTLIGDASEDPRSVVEKQSILRAIDQYGLARHVRLAGYASYEELMAAARAHHIFISPSITASDGDTEGGAPVTLIDMAASGIVILSSTHCDIPQVILNGRTGLLAPERDAATLAEHLATVARNPKLGAQLTVAGRKHVEANFDAVRQAELLAQQYLSIAHRP